MMIMIKERLGKLVQGRCVSFERSLPHNLWTKRGFEEESLEKSKRELLHKTPRFSNHSFIITIISKVDLLLINK